MKQKPQQQENRMDRGTFLKVAAAVTTATVVSAAVTRKVDLAYGAPPTSGTEVLANNTSIQWYDSGNTPRSILGLDSSNIFQIGGTGVSSIALNNNTSFSNNQALSMRVENVGALPAAGNAGRLVFLTTDNNIYRDSGSAFNLVSAVTSVFTRTGAVVAVNTDYATVGLSGTSLSGTYNIGGTPTVTATSLILKQTTANYTLSWNDPAAARTLTIPDPGGNDSFLFAAATQTISGKSIAATQLTGDIAVARMTVNGLAIQKTDIGSNFTTTSSSLTDITGLSVTPSSSRTRALVIAAVTWAGNAAASVTFGFTNTTSGRTYIDDVLVVNDRETTTFVEPVTTMGTIVKAQCSISGGNTLTVYSAGSIINSIES